MEGEQVTMKTADNGNEIAGILHGVRIGCGLLLERIDTIRDSGSVRHFLLLGLR